MSITPSSMPGSEELLAINRELSGLLHVAQASLSLGADAALNDSLVLCGVLGGKDVGKSTLVNALAGTNVSVDTEETGRGTRRPRAFVHRDVQAAAAQRLRVDDLGSWMDVTLHDADAMRSAVLIDLPDFDSEFHEHLELVRHVAPRLDRILWVVTPRKLGDREWAAIMNDVVIDRANVSLVLNKVDELLANADTLPDSADARMLPDGSVARGFWSGRHDWVARVSAEAGCATEEGARFLVAAAFATSERFVERVGQLWNDPAWSRFANQKRSVASIADLATKELHRLRAGVLSPVSESAAKSIKTLNLASQHRHSMEKLRRHFDLEWITSSLADACDPEYHVDLVRDAFGDEGAGPIVAFVLSRLRSPAELSGELLQKTVEGWPLLRIVYWAFGWFSRGLGRRAAGAARVGPQPAVEILADSHFVCDRIELIRARFLADHAALIERLRLHSEIPATERMADVARRLFAELPQNVEQDILDCLSIDAPTPGFISRGLLWLVLIWFPLLQPILKEGLRLYNDAGTVTAAVAGYHLISILGAGHLLTSLGVVLLIYVATLTTMFVRRLRKVQTALFDDTGPASGRSIEVRVEETFLSAIVQPLVLPFSRCLEAIQRIHQRLLFP